MEPIIAKRLATDLMEQHGLTGLYWNFKFDNSVKRFGCCWYRHKLISLSLPLTKLNSIEQVKDTILHEIAHALVGRGHGHNSVWKRKCIEIGAKPERCYSSKEVEQPELKYHAVCGGCGKVHQKARMVDKTSKRRCKCQRGKAWDNCVLLNFTKRY